MFRIQNYISRIPLGEYIRNYRDSAKFLMFCKQCTKYDSCWSCPHYTFNTTEYISGYTDVYIIGTKINIPDSIRLRYNKPEDSKSIGFKIIADTRMSIDNCLLKVESEIPKTRAFFAGTCVLCPDNTCTRSSNNPCRYPDKIRFSLESFGFDIGKTAGELLDIQLKWTNDGSLPEYFTLVSAIFSNSKIDQLNQYFKNNQQINSVITL